MGKPHPAELRERVIAFVEEGHTHRAAASHFFGIAAICKQYGYPEA